MMYKSKVHLSIALIVLAAMSCSSAQDKDPMAMESEGGGPAGMVEVKVYAIGAAGISGSPVIVLSDKEEGVFLYIGIGTCEATAISNKLKDIKFPRPLTHDLLRSILESLNVRVTRILVDDLKYVGDVGTYFARIIIEREDSAPVEVDSRPSDAIALALRVPAPIFVSEKIMEENGISDITGGKKRKEDKGEKEKMLREFF